MKDYSSIGNQEDILNKVKIHRKVSSKSLLNFTKMHLCKIETLLIKE